MFDARCVRNFYLLCCLAVLAACSNGRGSVDSEQPPPSGAAQSGFTVSGTVAGLDGDGLVVQLNGGNDLAVPNNGTFTFTTQLADAAAYNVTVLTQPSGPSQTCTIGNASGTIAAANVTNVAITCATGAFALRGTVSGLAGTGLVLQNNGADDLLIIADGPFGFPMPYASGAAYNVTVKTPPSGPSQSCTVANGAGTIGSADVTDVTVTCATGQFAIVVTVSGLAGSGPLVLQNNERDTLTISGNGTFQFPELLASGAMYDVRVATAPTNPAQNCAVDKGSGQVGAANVTNITVTCMTDSFKIGGPITNLLGTGLQLQLNNGPPLNVLPGPPGTFEFPALLPSGTSYVVDVRSPAERSGAGMRRGRGHSLGHRARSQRDECRSDLHDPQFPDRRPCQRPRRSRPGSARERRRDRSRSPPTAATPSPIGTLSGSRLHCGGRHAAPRSIADLHHRTRQRASSVTAT